MSTRILLVAPPLSDPNGPYPAVAYLAGFLQSIGRPAMQADASLAVLLAVMSRHGLATLVTRIQAQPALHARPRIAQFLRDADRYMQTIETAVSCLQGADHGAVFRARRSTYFPSRLEAARYWARKSLHNVRAHDRLLGGLSDQQRRRLAGAESDLFAFGTLGDIDRARHNASGMIADLATVIQEAVDPSFRLQAYASVLSSDLATFDPVRARLEGPPTFLDEVIDSVADALHEEYAPDLVGLSVPFAGSFYGALRIARQLRKQNPHIQIALGGGWVNTTLRQLSDPGIFDYVDFMTLDAGERPLQCLIEQREGRRSTGHLKRTFIREAGTVRFIDGAPEGDVPFAEWGTPSYSGLPLRQYFDLSVGLAPQARHWRVRWNKLTLAHGCYWKKCAFCDVNLDYIARYSPGDVDTLVSRIRELVDATGETGFHFVDEAMPPALVERLCRRLLEARVEISWWGNLRFDSAFLPLARLMAEAGCVAVTGGVEAASDRLLALMAKGISLTQVARVARAFADQGIAVHAYLIYGFPSQTAQETVDALEYVRQLFEAGCLHSARWHRFSLTAYSPVADRPDLFGVTVRRGRANPFGNYVLKYEEHGAPDHAAFGAGLNRAVARFAMGDCDGMPVHEWFDFEVPTTTLARDFVRAILGQVAANA